MIFNSYFLFVPISHLFFSCFFLFRLTSFLFCAYFFLILLSFINIWCYIVYNTLFGNRFQEQIRTYKSINIYTTTLFMKGSEPHHICHLFSFAPITSIKNRLLPFLTSKTKKAKGISQTGHIIFSCTTAEYYVFNLPNAFCLFLMQAILCIF